MKWEIDDDYTIETDHWSFTLKKYRKGKINPKTGKPAHTKGQWWFPTIEKCLDWYKEDRLMCSEKTEDVLSILKEIKVTIEGLKPPTLHHLKSEAVSPES